MHSRGPPNFPNVAATLANAVAALDPVDAVGAAEVMEAVEAVEVVKAVEAMEAVEAEIATRVSTPIANLIVILQMHAESKNTPRRENTTMSAFASSAGFQATSKSIASLTNV